MNTNKFIGIIPADVLSQLPLLKKYGLNSDLRLAHFIGQTIEESLHFTHFTENLNYSGAGLWSLFRAHFSSREEAESFAHQPERIANRIYADRMGNGDEKSGDGWKYRGRGAIPLTGKANYQMLSDATGIDFVSNPDLVHEGYDMAAAAVFFQHNKLWAICDKGISATVTGELTRHINGGALGLDERIALTSKAWTILTA